MEVEVFALLKDYFDKKFIVPARLSDIESLKQHLLDLNPAAEQVLSSCRFAVEDEFVDHNYQLKENDYICIIPPSSGG
ncbi:MoaD/ThiS family protein [Pedobacter sp. SYSU D00535]|uniref:MoaD/ThiS family protein n=1 Tax=Pedobacter sp. SYSU D00535 TaxID=2810308 RepID=UPI001A956E0E|nr:MoaD/ThiS family protein [Pedobacter sp. SYSU D00535]